jgi:hypothetical protein
MSRGREGTHMNSTEKWIVGIVIGAVVSALIKELLDQDRGTWTIPLPHYVT